MNVRRISLVVVGLSCLVTFASTRVDAAVVIALNAPAAGQAFAPNAPINYTGAVTYQAVDPDLDKVIVDYVWTNGQGGAPKPGAGVVVNSPKAATIVTPTVPGQQGNGGSATYQNAAPPAAAFTAQQYTMPGQGQQPQTTTYWVRAVPYSIRGGVYLDNQGRTIYAIQQLGAVR